MSVIGTAMGKLKESPSRSPLFNTLPPASASLSQAKSVPVATRWPAGLTWMSAVTPPPLLMKAVPVAASVTPTAIPPPSVLLLS